MSGSYKDSDKSSSQDELKSLKAELNELKSKKEIKRLQDEIDSLKKNKSRKKYEPNCEDYLFNNTRFKKKSHAKIYILSLVTFGIYYLFLLYEWITTLNKVRKEKIIDPGLAIFISIFTCFVACIYYDWKIAKEFELIAKEQEDFVANKRVVKPPIQNLKAITICINVFCLTASFISAGILLIPLLILPAWLNVEIQKAVDYAIELKARAELIDS